MDSLNFGLMGAWEHVLDDKSRVVVPMDWREDLGPTIILCRSLDSTPSIWGFSQAEFARLVSYLRSGVGLSDTEGANQIRVLSSSMAKVEVDKQGRIPLPAKLRDHAVIGGAGEKVVLSGHIDRFEIWQPEKHRDRLSQVETSSLLNKIDKARRQEKKVE